MSVMSQRRKVTALMMLFIFLFQLAFPAIAKADAYKGNNPVTIEQSDGTINVNDGKSRSRITTKESSRVRTVYIENLDDNKIDYITYDYAKGTLYSSITGRTIFLGGDSSGGITPKSKTSYSTSKVSWRAIRQACGATAVVSGVVAVFVAKAGPLAGLASAISAISNAGAFFAPDDPNHGIAIRIKTIKYYRNGNKVPYRTNKTVDKAYTY